MATEIVDSTTEPQIAVDIVDSTRPGPQLPRAATAQYNSPSLDFLADTSTLSLSLSLSPTHFFGRILQLIFRISFVHLQI